MCIFVPVLHQKTGDSLEVADAHIDRLGQLVANHPDKFEIVTSAAEVLKRADRPQVLLAMGMINGLLLGMIWRDYVIFINGGLGTSLWLTRDRIN